MEYNVVRQTSLNALISTMRVKLNDGWEPFGNLIVYVNAQGTEEYLQPIIRN
jgi:hypothetical protein